MPPRFSFRFFLADRRHPFHPEDPLAAKPLPGTRHGADGSAPTGTIGQVSYGDYLHAVRDFIQWDPAGTLGRACSDILGRPIDLNEIERVEVFLSKHGAFYHPCRVVTVTVQDEIELALNGAVSQNGREVIEREIGHLNRLGGDFPFDFLPRVYAFGNGRDRTNRPIPMFLAQWFSGFHECHLARRGAGRPARMRVWTDNAKERYLSVTQAAQFYRLCSLILTCYYQPLTFEQIFPWHHAAGDFVVAFTPHGIDVRLVTVRDYRPLFPEIEGGSPPGNERVSERRILDGLLVFFLAMSLRMRLDRHEGVGEIIWAPIEALTGAVEGFFQGLELLRLRYGLPEGMPAYFRSYLLSHSPRALAGLCRDIADRYPPGSGEQIAARRHCTMHAAALRRRVAAAQPGLHA